jgi:hypothetical protein
VASTELQRSLVRLEQALRDHGAPIAQAFRPGLPPGDVAEALRAEGLAPHDDVIAWFGWHDGADVAAPHRDESGDVIRYGGESVLVGPWSMFELRRALSDRRQALDAQAADVARFGDGAASFAAGWLPLATSEGAGELCIDTTAAGVAPLWIHDPETQDGRRSPQFASLVDLADALVAVLARRLVVPHPHDDRAAMVDHSRLPSTLRRLSSW